MSSVLSDIGSLATAAGVAVAAWQVSASAKSAKETNSLSAVSNAFNEFRSREFQDHLRKVWDTVPSDVPKDGFQSPPGPWRDSAYEVAYFFEHLGILVEYKLVPQELVVDFSANLIVRSWKALKPSIEMERMHRRSLHKQESDPPDPFNPPDPHDPPSAGFVTHFEKLTELVIEHNRKSSNN